MKCNFRNNLFMGLEKIPYIIDDKGLSESTSLTHLLSDEDSSEKIDVNNIKPSPYYSESDFHDLQLRKGNLSFLSLYCPTLIPNLMNFNYLWTA